MITLNLSTEPAPVRLEWPFETVTLNVHPMGPNQFSEVAKQTVELMSDRSAVAQLAELAGLMSKQQRRAWEEDELNLSDEMNHLTSGFGLWLGSVLLAETAITSWSGVVGEDGNPAPLDRSTLAVAMASEGLAEQIISAIDSVRKIQLQNDTVGVAA